jgi:DNA mismatch repair ATPase MutL
LAAAAKASKGDPKATRKAIALYLAERGYDPESGKKLDAKPKKKASRKEKKEKKAKKKEAAASDDDDEEEDDDEEDEDAGEEEAKPKKKAKGGDPAKEKLIAAGAKKALKGDPDAGVPVGNIDMRKLNRQTLRGMAKDLGIKAKKKWSDDEFRSVVAKHMTGVDAAVTAAIAKADPAKIDALTDCIGILLDLTKAICITCPAQSDCRKVFDQHRADGFKIFETLQTNVATPATATTVIPAASLVKEKTVVAEVVLKPERAIEVYEITKVKELPTVEVDGHAVNNMEHKEFLRALVAEVPATLQEFKNLVTANYDASTDDPDALKLTMWFVRYCTALEVIKLV